MSPIAFLQNLNTPEIIMIFLVVLLFFGAKRLPDLFRSVGKSLREFKKATSEIEDDIRTAMDEEPEVKRPAKKTSSASTEATTAPKEVDADQLDEELESDDAPEKDKTENKEKTSS
ncbi:MAG: twin-arginine translocase TatA/TatE family subunit [Opitutales bacterium]